MDKRDKPIQLVERACRALAQTQACLDWDNLPAEKQERFRFGVRAVLEALRDPDTAMVEAGARIIRNVRATETEMAYLTDATDTWRYMIDVLLAEAR